MTTREQYEDWFRGYYKQEPMPELGAPAHDFCWAGYIAGAASRDAEDEHMSLRPVMQKVLAQAQYELGNYKQLTKENQMENQNSNEEKLPQLRANVYDAIGTERYYQEQKWGSIEEHPQSVGGYLTLMRVHLTNAEAAWAGSTGDTDALHYLRKVLALGVACGEQHGLPKRDFNNYPE